MSFQMHPRNIHQTRARSDRASWLDLCSIRYVGLQGFLQNCPPAAVLRLLRQTGLSLGSGGGDTVATLLQPTHLTSSLALSSIRSGLLGTAISGADRSSQNMTTTNGVG